VEETSEALADQLGLAPGEGLVVTHVSADSPAAKAGLKKNDVLIDSRAIAGDPGTLRKLVQGAKAGERVKLVFLPGRQEHTESAARKTLQPGSPLDEGSVMRRCASSSRVAQASAWRLAPWPRPKPLHDSLRHVPGEGAAEVETEIRRGMEQARKALTDAAREVDQNKDSPPNRKHPAQRTAKIGISVDDNATLVVRSKGKSSRSVC